MCVIADQVSVTSHANILVNTRVIELDRRQVAVCHRAAANYEGDVLSEAELSLISAQCSVPL